MHGHVNFATISACFIPGARSRLCQNSRGNQPGQQAENCARPDRPHRLWVWPVHLLTHHDAKPIPLKLSRQASIFPSFASEPLRMERWRRIRQFLQQRVVSFLMQLLSLGKFHLGCRSFPHCLVHAAQTKVHVGLVRVQVYSVLKSRKCFVVLLLIHIDRTQIGIGNSNAILLLNGLLKQNQGLFG